MKKKKIITLLIGLTCFLECGITPLLTQDNALYVIAAEECESYDDGDFSFYLFGNHAELYKTKKTITKAIIPSSVKGLPVTKIDGFAYREQLVSVVIPDTVTTIQEGAFYGCNSLVSISIPDSVTEIERTAFSNCSAIESIDLPNSLININEYAFSACKSLKSIVIPEGVTTIEQYAFRYCDSLASVDIADSVTSIGYAAFGNCQNLSEVKLPNNAAYIHPFAFTSSPFGTEIGNINKRKIGNLTYNIYKDYVSVCDCDESAKEVIIPNNLYGVPVTEIEDYAFCDCKELVSIEIPKSIKSIGQSFSYCEKLKSVVIPEGVERIESETFRYCFELEKVDIPESVKEIGECAFERCWKLDNIILPDNLKRLERNAFLDCISLSSITIPKSITVIEDGTFDLCQRLDNVVFHDNITEIGKIAFYGINATYINIPDSVQKIGENAFSGCYDLQEFSIPNHLKNDIINKQDIYPEVIFIRNNKRTRLDYDIENNKNGLCNIASNKSITLDNINYNTFTKNPNDMEKNDFLKNYNNGFRSLDILQEVLDKDENAFAIYGEKDFVNIIPENTKLKSIKINNPGFTFGAAEIGDDNYIYIIWGKELTKDEINNYPQTENIIICKYDMNGKQVDYLGLPIEKTLAQYPFSGGNANIKYKNGVLGVLYDTEWSASYSNDGIIHQGSEFAAINASDMTLIDFSDYEGSHSLGVSMIKTDFGLAAIQMGDAGHSRGINMNRYSIDSEGGFGFLSKGDILFHSSGIYEQMGFLNRNNTFLHMGGIAESNSTFALAGKGEKEYSSDLVINSDVLTEQYDVFVRIIDKSLFNADDLVNGTERRNVINNNIADRNVIWLMECNDIEKAGNVKVVILKTGAYCVLWEKFINDEFDSIRYVIIDEVGNILRNETGIYNARLSDTSIQPIVNDMTLKWAIADKEKSSIIWYSVNLDELVDKRIKGDANNDGKVTVADAVMLQKWLLGASTELTCWQNVDLCEYGQIDVFDLCLLKRLLLQK